MINCKVIVLKIETLYICQERGGGGEINPRESEIHLSPISKRQSSRGTSRKDRKVQQGDIRGPKESHNRLSYDPTVRLDEAFHLDGGHVGFEHCRMEDRTKVNTKTVLPEQHSLHDMLLLTCFRRNKRPKGSCYPKNDRSKVLADFPSVASVAVASVFRSEWCRAGTYSLSWKSMRQERKRCRLVDLESELSKRGKTRKVGSKERRERLSCNPSPRIVSTLCSTILQRRSETFLCDFTVSHESRCVERKRTPTE